MEPNTQPQKPHTKPHLEDLTDEQLAHLAARIEEIRLTRGYIAEEPLPPLTEATTEHNSDTVPDIPPSFEDTKPDSSPAPASDEADDQPEKADEEAMEDETEAGEDTEEIPFKKGGKKKAKKKPKGKQILCFLSILLALLLILLALFYALLSSLEQYKPEVAAELPFHIHSDKQEENTDSIDPSDTDDDTAPQIADASAYERIEDTYNFLVLGIDRAANLSDVIMLVNYNVDEGTLHVVSLPRDTYIDTGSNYHKLNAYFAASYNHSASKGEQRYVDAIESMVSFLEQGLSVKIDRYICMDTAGFRDIVDAIGGVDVDVPCDMNYEDPEQELYIHLSAGYQHLDGDKAEQFVRFRKGYMNGDIGRISAQKLFLTAFAKKIQASLSVTTAVSLAKTVLSYVTTDLNTTEVAYFAKKALSVSFDNITFTTIPGEGVVNPDSGASYYVLYGETMRTVLNEELNVYKTDIPASVFYANSTAFSGTQSYCTAVFSGQGIAESHSASEIEESGVTIPTW